MKVRMLSLSTLMMLGFAGHAIADGGPELVLAIPSEVLASSEGPVFLDEVVQQTNVNSPVSAYANVSNNWGLDHTEVDVTAVGNNASIEVVDDEEFATHIDQSNVNSAVTGQAFVNENFTTSSSEIFIDVTAVGNNASIDQASLNGSIGATVSQINDNSPVSAIGTSNGNSFGFFRPRDPDIESTAVGNNLSVSLDPLNGSDANGNVTAQIGQANLNSPVTAVGEVAGNRSLFGGIIVNVSATAVGNNFSVDLFENEDE